MSVHTAHIGNFVTTVIHSFLQPNHGRLTAQTHVLVHRAQALSHPRGLPSFLNQFIEASRSSLGVVLGVFWGGVGGRGCVVGDNTGLEFREMASKGAAQPFIIVYVRFV